MTTQTVYHSTTLVLMTCWKCGVNYGMNRTLYDAAKADHRINFYCVGCGVSTVMVGQTTEERLKAELERTRDSVSYWRAEQAATERTARAYKGQATKLRKKAQHGVCPVTPCTRTFSNLATHMAKEHPDFAPDQIDREIRRAQR